MKPNRSVRLYNVMFPIWFFLFFPTVWLIVLPVNFLVDSLVLWLSAKHQSIEKRLPLWKKYIFPVWGIGFLADLIGAGLIFLIYSIIVEIPGLTEVFNPILFPGTCIISLPGVILSGILIYWLNRKLTFRRSPLHDALLHKLCLHLALFTAPYTMLIPLYW